MLQQPVDQFVPRIFLFLRRRIRIARQEHFRLDVNQHRGHINKFGRHVHIEFANFLDVGQILRRDARDGNVINVDILLADQVQQQVERAFVNIGHGDRKRRIALFLLRRVPGWLRGRQARNDRWKYGRRRIIARNEFCIFRHSFFRLVILSEAKQLCTLRDIYLPWPTFGASYSSDMPIAARTSSIVSPAALRARSVPASRISQASRGFSSNFLRRSCMGFNSLTSASAAQPLHSIQPMLADRQPSYTLAIVPLSLKILCRSPTGHTSGLPGSDRRTRAGSVTMVFSFCRTTDSGSVSSTVFPYDFDILRPSVPGSFAAGVSSACGSGNTSFGAP